MVSQEEVLKVIPFDKSIRHGDIAAKLGLDRDAKIAMSKHLRSSGGAIPNTTGGRGTGG